MKENDSRLEQKSVEIFGHPGNPVLPWDTLPGERDPRKWPFSRTSIWNMPIGADAEYEHAGLSPIAQFGIDPEEIYLTDKTDEQLENYGSGMHNRWPADLTGLINHGKTYWPRGKVVPQTSRANDCTAILQPDGRTVIELQPTCRDDASSTHVIGYPVTDIDLYGDGILGTHWGSGLSTLGGSIRLGELTGDAPIRHALKLDIWGKAWLGYDGDSKGFTWPAIKADGYANDPYNGGYCGRNKHLLLGCLLALRPDATPESVGIRTPIGEKLFFTLQNYGCYLVDDSYYEGYNLCAQRAVIAEVKEKYDVDMRSNLVDARNRQTAEYGADLMRLIERLYIVTNNAPDRIGGGGKPRQPLAPDLPAIR